jgi:hypothetical protein
MTPRSQQSGTAMAAAANVAATSEDCFALAPAWTTNRPRNFVRQLLFSIALVPSMMASAQGCLMERHFIAIRSESKVGSPRDMSVSLLSRQPLPRPHYP